MGSEIAWVLKDARIAEKFEKGIYILLKRKKNHSKCFEVSKFLKRRFCKRAFVLYGNGSKYWNMGFCFGIFSLSKKLEKFLEDIILVSQNTNFLSAVPTVRLLVDISVVYYYLLVVVVDYYYCCCCCCYYYYCCLNTQYDNILPIFFNSTSVTNGVNLRMSPVLPWGSPKYFMKASTACKYMFRVLNKNMRLVCWIFLWSFKVNIKDMRTTSICYSRKEISANAFSESCLFISNVSFL